MVLFFTSLFYSTMSHLVDALISCNNVYVPFIKNNKLFYSLISNQLERNLTKLLIMLLGLRLTLRFTRIVNYISEFSAFTEIPLIGVQDTFKGTKSIGILHPCDFFVSD